MLAEVVITVMYFTNTTTKTTTGFKWQTCPLVQLAYFLIHYAYILIHFCIKLLYI
jgi:hypothetical protein